MYSYGPLHIAERKQDDQLEHRFSSYVRIRDVALKTYQKRWTIGGSGEERVRDIRGAARHDDDDDIYCNSIFLHRDVLFKKSTSSFSCCVCIFTHTHIHKTTFIRPHTVILNYNTRTHTHTLTSTHKDLYTIPTVFDCIFRFFRFLVFLSLSAWWLLFVKLHETWGRRHTSMALNI